MTDKEIIQALNTATNIDGLQICCIDYENNPKNTTFLSIKSDIVDLINRQQAEIERLTTIAKKMHSWIFTNSYDEEKAYAECGLTDEENTLLGYCGKIVFESKEMVGEQK